MARSQKSQLQALLREPERLLPERLLMREPLRPARHPAEDAMAFIGGILLGALIGGIAAIFLAPTDGRSLRQRVRETLGMDSGADEPAIEYVPPAPSGTSAAEAEEVSGPVGAPAMGVATGA